MELVHGGYQTLSPIQICNAVGALRARRISLRAFRAYFACAAIAASRDAARRARRSEPGRRPPARPRFGVDEVAQLLDCASLRVVRAELRSLAAAGLLTFAVDTLELCKQPTEDSSELLAVVASRRSPTRPIPVPRRILRLLARPGRASTAIVVLSYMLRGLTLDRKTGEVRGRGSVKASWIADLFGLSLRSVRSARAELVRLGLIRRDEASSQWKLNRTGTYFSWNLAWSGASSSAPLGVAAASHPAPPMKRPRTPYGSRKNQEPVGPGVPRKPDIREVVPEDLGSLPRLDELYRQAVRRRILDGTESDALNFVCAAARALSVPCRSPERVFMGIVRKRLWSHVTLAQEDRARSSMARFRRSRPEAFRPERPVPSILGPRFEREGPTVARSEIRELIKHSLGLAA